MEDQSANQYSERSPQRIEESGPPERDARKFEIASADALAELYDLLRDYAPPWYTERHHQKAENVLRMLGRL
jgi:hypothetical protein